jgi:flavorubredoxin
MCLQAVLPHYRFYYDCLMKPNARSVITALRKVPPATLHACMHDLHACVPILHQQQNNHAA